VVIAGALPPPHKPIGFDPVFVEQLGGIAIPRAEIIRILESLGFVVEDHGILQVVPPSWRHDIDGPADLVEEVVRIYGLASVKAVPLPRETGVAKPVLTRAQRRAKAARRALAARGFNEAVSFSFMAREHAALFGGGDAARQLFNPIASDLDALRPTPLPALLMAARRNAARGFSDLSLFEIGPGFSSGMPEAQATIAAGLRSGHALRDWSKSTHDADAFDVKADMLAALEAVTGAPMSAPITRGAPGWYHPGRSGVIALGKNVIAQFGELHPIVLAAFDLKVPAAAFEIFLDALPEAKAKGKARPLFAPSPYQAIERDFAFVVKREVAGGDIIKAARLADRALIDSVSIFDVYEGKGVPGGMKSVAVAVRIQPKDKTLTDAEIEAVAAAIVAQVTKATGASLRS
jgi:phenylalanyl-tRNA synthetase beta chain